MIHPDLYLGKNFLQYLVDITARLNAAFGDIPYVSGIYVTLYNLEFPVHNDDGQQVGKFTSDEEGEWSFSFIDYDKDRKRVEESK